MEKLLIIDICNTLADVNGELKNRGYDPSGHALPADLPIFVDESLYWNAKPWHKSIEYVHHFVGLGYTPIYLTARPQSMLPVSVQWLDKYGLPNGPIICSADSNKGDKLLEVLSEYGLDAEVIILEDSPKEIGFIQRVTAQYNLNVRIYIPRHEYNETIQGYGEIILNEEKVS